MNTLDKIIFWLIRRLSTDAKRAILSCIDITVCANIRNKHDHTQIFEHPKTLYEIDLDRTIVLSDFLYDLGEHEAMTPVIFWNHPVNELKDFSFKINTKKLGRLIHE